MPCCSLWPFPLRASWSASSAALWPPMWHPWRSRQTSSVCWRWGVLDNVVFEMLFFCFWWVGGEGILKVQSQSQPEPRFRWSWRHFWCCLWSTTWPCCCCRRTSAWRVWDSMKMAFRPRSMARPSRRGGWRVPAVQTIPKCLAVWRSSSVSKTASSTKFYLFCGQPPRLYIKRIPE